MWMLCWAFQMTLFIFLIPSGALPPTLHTHTHTRTQNQHKRKCLFVKRARGDRAKAGPQVLVKWDPVKCQPLLTSSCQTQSPLCVWQWVCLSVCVWMCVSEWVCLSECVWVCVWVCVRVSVCECESVCVSVCLWECMWVCVNVCDCECVNVSVNV